MIEGATHSNYSHCGMVFRMQGKWIVAESIGKVHTTSLYWWIRRGRQARFVVFRLRPKYQSHINEIRKAVFSYMGRPYDFKYSMDDQAIYCSELIYKAFLTATGEEMGQLVELASLNWRPYEKIIRELDDGDLPLQRKMITPRDLARATQLTRVCGFFLD